MNKYKTEKEKNKNKNKNKFKNNRNVKEKPEKDVEKYQENSHLKVEIFITEDKTILKEQNTRA